MTAEFTTPTPPSPPSVDLSTEQWVDSVLHFWFEELSPEVWFAGGEQLDSQIRSRFGSLHERVQSIDITSLRSPRQHLAAVIVLDQFSRNMHRGTPRAFASDALALNIARRAIAMNLDAQLNTSQRIFLYMPFQHAEDREVQSRSLELFSALGDAVTLDYARQHKEIVDRFGRFPHRNSALGRESTQAELEFVRTHKGF